MGAWNVRERGRRVNFLRGGLVCLKRRGNHPDMKVLVSFLSAILLPWPLFAANELLIVADEFPAMEHVAAQLKAQENLTSRIVWQTNLPPDLSQFSAVLVYIHGRLNEPAEMAFIAYVQAGGKLVVLHHSVSSGKRKNRQWFSFLGVALPEADVSAGGYKWIEGIRQQIVNLARSHFITTHKLNYPEQVEFKAVGETAERTLPGFTLKESEVYLNHELAEDRTRTRLLGFKYRDKTTGKTYMQSHAGWVKPSGKGWIVYLQPGHDLHDLTNSTFERIVLNAVIWKP